MDKIKYRKYGDVFESPCSPECDGMMSRVVFEKKHAFIDKETGEIIEPNEDRPRPKVFRDINLNKIIQSYKPTCDLAALYARSVQLNDPSLLNIREGSYGDFSDMPSNIFEADKMSIDMLNKFEANYDKLPDDIKDVFGSKTEFINAVFQDRLNDYLEKLPKKEDLNNA